VSINEALQKLLHDQQLVAVFALVGLDILLGVVAALVPSAASAGKFNFNRIVDFLRDDVLEKVVPWAIIYVFAALYSGLGVLGVNLGDIANGIYVVMLAALVASLLTSLSDLGLPVGKIPVVGGTLSRP
jgi:hypothetical protein